MDKDIFMVAKARTKSWTRGIMLTQADFNLSSNTYKRSIKLKNNNDPFEQYLISSNFFPNGKLRYPSSYNCQLIIISKNIQGCFVFQYPDESSETFNNLWINLEKSIQDILQSQL